jgi:hypothetical protein
MSSSKPPVVNGRRSVELRMRSSSEVDDAMLPSSTSIEPKGVAERVYGGEGPMLYRSNDGDRRKEQRHGLQ